MLRLLCLTEVVLVLTMVGCSDPLPAARVTALAPGQGVSLTYRCEMQTSGASVTEDHNYINGEDRLVSRTEHPYEGVDWAEMDLSGQVSAVPRSDSLKTVLTITRARMGHTYTPKGESTREESHGFEASRPGDPGEDMGLDHLRDSRFIATIGPWGQITSSDVLGEYWAERKKELSEAVKAGASQKQVDLALRFDTPGIFAALEDALAYFPPESVRVGESWTVRRPTVLPYHAYGFYMFTNGCYYSEEDSRCRLSSVEFRDGHAIATIVIRGKRIPHDPEESMPERVKFLELIGELRADLTTGAVESLRLESTSMWAKPDEEGMKLKLVQTISLKPI